MSKIAISPDLMKLKGAKIIAGKGGVLHVVIPIETAGLVSFARKNGDQGVNLPMQLVDRTDNYGNDYMVVRSNTKAEIEFNKTADNEHKMRGEILGNGKIIGNPEAEEHNAAATDTAAGTFEGDKDDLPF